MLVKQEKEESRAMVRKKNRAKKEKENNIGLESGILNRVYETNKPKRPKHENIGVLEQERFDSGILKRVDEIKKPEQQQQKNIGLKKVNSDNLERVDGMKNTTITEYSILLERVDSDILERVDEIKKKGSRGSRESKASGTMGPAGSTGWCNGPRRGQPPGPGVLLLPEPAKRHCCNEDHGDPNDPQDTQ